MRTTPMSLESLRQKFTEFRGPEVSKEESYWETVKSIQEYVEKLNSLEQVEQDINDINSSTIKQFNPKKQIFLGTLLYGKLAIDHYLESISSNKIEEKKLLQELSKILGDIYATPKNTDAKSLSSLITLTNEWLDKYRKSSESAEVINLCNAMFAMFTVIKVISKNYDTLHSFMNMPAAIAINAGKPKTFEQDIKKLSEKIKSTVVTSTKSQTKEQCHKASGDKPPSLFQYYDDQCISILQSHKLNEEEKLSQLDKSLSNANKEIELLIADREKKASLKLQIESLRHLLKIAEKNDTKSSGRLYFSDLITENNDIYSVLIDNLNEPEKSKFLKKVEDLQTKSLKSAALWTLSTISAPAITMFRKITPKKIQERIVSASYLQTLDSECKTTAKKLIKQCLDNLQSQVDTETRLTSLPDHQSLSQLDQIATEELRIFISSNTATLEALQAYRRLEISILQTEAIVKSLKEDSITVNQFIKKNDNALRRFFGFFSTLFEKKSFSSRIDDAKALAKQINNCIHSFKFQIDEQLKDFNIIDEKIKKLNPQGKTADTYKTIFKKEIENKKLNTPASSEVSYKAAINEILNKHHHEHKNDKKHHKK